MRLSTESRYPFRSGKQPGSVQIARLPKVKLVEGRRPRLRVNADIAAITGAKVQYIRRRAQDDAHFARLVVGYPQQFDGASWKEIDELQGKYLPDTLDTKQQHSKVTNLLTRMRTEGTIRNSSSQ